MNKDSFDAVAFVAWFESIIDFILSLFEKIKAKLNTTTTVISEETPVE